MKISFLSMANVDHQTPLNFIGIIAAGTILQLILIPRIDIRIPRLTYLHYHMIETSIEGNEDLFRKNKINAQIYKNGVLVTTIGGKDSIDFTYTPEDRLWKGKFPVPWAAPEGIYSVKVFDDKKQLSWDEVFLIKTRIPSIKFSTPLKIVNLESTKKLGSYKIKSPSGKISDYTAIFDWIKYIGGNTLWYLAGQTASYKKGDLDEDSPWLKSNLNTLKIFAQKTRKNNINFGAWVSCFRYFGKSSLKPDWYDYSYKYMRSQDELQKTKGISILNNRRIEDIKKLLKEINSIDEINFIGLDYIRPAGGGLELVDEFVEIMEVEVPPGWNEFSKKQRMKWLGKIVTRTKDRKLPVIDKWNWWRAHQMSKIIYDLKQSVGLKKPLWAFVLSWELGHQHGQDPIMFQDAGVDLIAIMMYETDSPRYKYILKEWEEYLEGFNINIAIGNQIDWPLHQYSVYPAGPSKYYGRIEKGIDSLNKSGNVKGVFINDFARAMWGRKGPYTSKEWMLAGGKGFSKLTSDFSKIKVDIDAPENIRTDKIYSLSIHISNLTDQSLTDIELDIPEIQGIEVSKKVTKINKLSSGETRTVRIDLKINGNSGHRMGRYMLAVRAILGEEVYSDYKYLWVKDIPLDTGIKYR